MRRRNAPRVIGSAGVSAFFAGEAPFWNLGYRFDADVHKNGYAVEACRVALSEARRVHPDVPVVAYLLEHDVRSARLAERLGLGLVHRGPDAGNPDPCAVRLVYADRPLDAGVVLAAMR